MVALIQTKIYIAARKRINLLYHPGKHCVELREPNHFVKVFNILSAGPDPSYVGCIGLLENHSCSPAFDLDFFPY